MVSRVSTIAQHQQVIADIGSAQVGLADLQRQISSGQKADSFPDLGASISRTIDLQSRIKASEHYTTGNNVVVSRLKMMNSSVDSLTKVAQEFRSLITQENSSSGSVIDLTGTAETSLKKVADALNVSLNGRYLFAGGKTENPPINAHDIQESNVEYDEFGEPTGSDSYYDGDSEKFVVQASESLEVEYGVTGDDIAFRKLIASMHKAIEAEAEGGTLKADKLGEALTLMNDAIDGLTQVNYSINTNIVTLNNTNDIHTAVTVQLKEFLAKENDADIVDASIKVSLGQATLTALLQTFAKISQLTLTDFLR